MLGDERAGARRVPVATLDALRRRYNREDSASDPVHRVRPYRRRRRPRGGRVLCRGAGVRPGRQRAQLDRHAVRGSSGRSRRRSCGRSIPAAPHPELQAMVHRWTRGEDIAALLWLLRQMLEQSGSIERFFADGLDPATPKTSARRSISSRRARWRSTSARAYGARRRSRPGVCYFFPRPSAGSACKRLNLYLRWMVRRDEVDLGAWTRCRRRS